MSRLLDLLETFSGLQRSWDYVVFLMRMAGAPQDNSFVGTAFPDGFSLFFTDNAEPQAIEQLLLHEMLHEWLPTAFPPLPPPEQDMYWFSERFTEYLTDRLLRDWEFIDHRIFVERMNAHLQLVATSPWADLDHEALERRFFESCEISELTYARGAVLALLWDLLHIGTRQCIRFARSEVSRFDLGFDHESVGRDGRIVGVKAGGPAWRAGLRDGQRYTSGQWNFKDPEDNAEITIQSPDGETRTLVYLPRSPKPVNAVTATAVEGCSVKSGTRAGP